MLFAIMIDLAIMLKKANTVFNVGVLTLKAAEAALQDPAHLKKY